MGRNRRNDLVLERSVILKSTLKLFMRIRPGLAVCVLGLVFAWGLLRAQKPFKEYPALEYENFPIPANCNPKDRVDARPPALSRCLWISQP